MARQDNAPANQPYQCGGWKRSFDTMTDTGLRQMLLHQPCLSHRISSEAGHVLVGCVALQI